MNYNDLRLRDALKRTSIFYAYKQSIIWSRPPSQEYSLVS